MEVSMQDKTLGFIGGGKMAEALIGAFLRSKRIHKESVYVSDPDPARQSLLLDNYSITVMDDNARLVRECDIIFLATKPQDLAEILQKYGESFTEKHLVVSIAAGITIGYLEELLPQSRIIRTMPNTPCLVGEMAAGYALGTCVTAADADNIAGLLDSAGVCVELPEEQLDAVTGLSGSGPAFVAAYIRALADAGISQGLSPKVAERLALQTVLGTAVLLRDKDLAPETLIAMVSSPKGTTLAGRAVLESSDFHRIIEDTVAAATHRSKELTKG